MVAMLVFTTVFLSVVVVNMNALRTSDTSHMVVTALQDAHTTIEQIRNTSTQGLAQVTATFPNGAAVQGFFNLVGELVVVTYPNPKVDPLNITVTVTWQDRGRAMTRSLNTQVTQR